MKFTTTKTSRLTIDNKTAKQLFQNLRHYFEDPPVEDGEPTDDPFCIAYGYIDGKNPVEFTIYLDPSDNDGEDAADEEELRKAFLTD